MKKALDSSVLIVFVMGVIALFTTTGYSQNPQAQEKIAELKQSMAKNKQALAQYSWQEQDTISIKGEVKKQELFQVRMGPDGKNQKTAIGTQAAQQQSSGGRQGRVKQRVVEKKTEEFKEYAQQIKELAQAYAHPDPQKLQQAFQQGNLSLASAGSSSMFAMTIKNYLKPNDSVVLTLAKNTGIKDIKINSYLKDPSDAVNLAIQFEQLPDGTNHVSTMSLDGVSKKLNVAIRNSNYQKM
jgi:hypothetical protein